MPTNTSSPSATSTSSARRGGRLAALDGLRILAALLVVMYHYVGTNASHIWREPNFKAFPGLYQFATYGFLGVQFFFIISGFVICMSSWDRSLKDFFVSRTVRLFPMYWAAVIISFLVVHFNASTVATLRVVGQPRSTADLLLNFTMAQGSWGIPNIDAVYWTLWVELKFYLLFAVVVWLGVTYKRALMFCALWLIAAIVCVNLNEPFLQAVIQPVYAPLFVAGILLFLVHRFGSTPLLWGMIGLCYLISVHQVLSDTLGLNGLFGIHMKWRYSAIMITVFYAAVSAVALGWLRWAKWRWLTVAGVLTYPLYLLHQDIGLIIIRSFRDEIPKWPLLLGTILTMLIAAYLGHRLIERPVAPRLKRLLISSLNFDPRPRIADARRGATVGPEPADGAVPANGVVPVDGAVPADGVVPPGSVVPANGAGPAVPDNAPISPAVPVSSASGGDAVLFGGERSWPDPHQRRPDADAAVPAQPRGA